MSQNLPPFHLAVPVDDLNAARLFYTEILGCTEGRSSDKWIDFNFFGHQFVVHESKASQQNLQNVDNNVVDGDDVPSFHFGVILNWDKWHELADSLKKASIEFIIEPRIRFQGETGEQATMFFCDPAGNAIEMKSFKDMSQIFAT